MITYIASEIGTGKTCYAVKLARKYLKKGKEVYSNVGIDGCKFFKVEDLLERVFPENSFIIIDELGTSFNSRDFKTNPKYIINYLKLSRHYHNDLVLISQTFNDGDKQMRDLASKIKFIRSIVKDKISIVVNVKGKIGITLANEIQMLYTVGRLGLPFFLPFYFKFYNSFEAEPRPFVPSVLIADINQIKKSVFVSYLKNKFSPIYKFLKSKFRKKTIIIKFDLPTFKEKFNSLTCEDFVKICDKNCDLCFYHK